MFIAPCTPTLSHTNKKYKHPHNCIPTSPPLYIYTYSCIRMHTKMQSPPVPMHKMHTDTHRHAHIHHMHTYTPLTYTHERKYNTNTHAHHTHSRQIQDCFFGIDGCLAYYISPGPFLCILHKDSLAAAVSFNATTCRQIRSHTMKILS